MIQSEIEKELIDNDYTFCLQYSKQKNGVFSLFVIPFISMLTLEICNYFDSKSHNVHLSNIRAKAKLLDDKQIDIKKTITLYEHILDDHYQYFRNLHKGVFGRAVRYLQPDIGVYKYKGHFIGSTILSNFYMSKTHKNTLISELEGKNGMAYDIGVNIGVLIGDLVERRFLEDRRKDGDIKFIDSTEITYIDYKSKKFYKNIFGGTLQVGIIQIIQSFISLLNFSYYCLESEVIQSEVKFKIRYITIYHVVSSIKKLQGYFHKYKLITAKSDEVFREIFSDKSINDNLSNKKFRNILVHYRLKDIDCEILEIENPLFGLVEYYHKDLSYKKLARIVTIQNIRISNLLSDWMDDT